MKMVLTALTLVALASLPTAAASEAESYPCILYPWTYHVGGYWVTTPGAYVPGQSVNVWFVHVQTDPVWVTGASVWVPYVTSVTTPGICYGDVQSIVDALLRNVAA